MTPTIYAIEMRSLRTAIHHLQTIDLVELTVRAKKYGTPADLALIASVQNCLGTLPLTHP